MPLTLSGLRALNSRRSAIARAVPEVAAAYGLKHVEFGPEFILPFALDPRIMLWESPAVAQAAMKDGVANTPVDLVDYPRRLQKRAEGLAARLKLLSGFYNLEI